jgi:hypothetical protein
VNTRPMRWNSINTFNISVITTASNDWKTSFYLLVWLLWSSNGVWELPHLKNYVQSSQLFLLFKASNDSISFMFSECSILCIILFNTNFNM